MNPRSATQGGKPSLKAASDAHSADENGPAAADEFWIVAQLGQPTRGARWIKLIYRSSFLDPLIRPVLRLLFEGGARDHYLPAPLHGRGVWIGYIPEGTLDARIRPALGSGKFSFEIESCETLSTRNVLLRMWRGSAERTGAAFIASIRKMPIEAMEHAAYALCHTPFDHYDQWRRERLRAFEPGGIDRPRVDWRAAPRIRLLVDVVPGDEAALERLLKSLSAQPYPDWSVVATRDPKAFPTGKFQGWTRDGKLLFAATPTDAQLTANLDPMSLVGRCRASDEIPESALAIVAEHAAANPTQTVIYGDGDWKKRDGRYHTPELKPDWSPAFQERANYIGAPVFVRASLLANKDAAKFANPAIDVSEVVALAGQSVGHIRRILLTRISTGVENTSARRRATSPLMPALKRGPGKASIIIPTRDRLKLLKPCVDSILEKTGATPFEIIIVDNGSVDPKTIAYFADIRKDRRCQIISRPGPFNFSSLCNDGASAALGDVLVFLNNDTKVLTDHWLEPLIDWATREGVGAVGAKLLFPSGKLQHAGVVTGLAGRADHPGAGIPGDDPGYLGWASHAREVSAVTGACLAVAKTKFDAIEGFNANDLPVDLNDIDLCLRLRERGLANMFAPGSVLLHFESASRGRFAQPSKKYARERAYFMRRWAAALRDDPYFHPSLSLHSVKPALG